MALVEASRTSELHVLDLQYHIYRPEGVMFRLASLTKKRTPELPPKEVFFGVNACIAHQVFYPVGNSLSRNRLMGANV